MKNKKKNNNNFMKIEKKILRDKKVLCLKLNMTLELETRYSLL